jgi:hypothetical protein
MLYSYTFLTISNSFDYNDKNGGTSFKASHKNWRESQLVDDFTKWGAESFGRNLFSLKKSALMRQHFRGLTNRLQR